MKFFTVLKRAFKRARVFLFGADVMIERLVPVSGNLKNRLLEIDIAQQEMRKEAARHLGIEHYELCLEGDMLFLAFLFGRVSLPSRLQLGTTEKIHVVFKDHLSGTQSCHYYYNGYTGLDDKRCRLRLNIKARGLLPWGPLQQLIY